MSGYRTTDERAQDAMSEGPTLNYYADTGGNDAYTARCRFCFWEGSYRGPPASADRDWFEHMAEKHGARP